MIDMTENKPYTSNQPFRKGEKFLEELKKSEQHLKESDAEFDQAFEIINRNPKRVSVFGSARDVEGNAKARADAYQFGQKIAKAGFAVVSGGGPGIMNAVNKGAFDADGKSIGFNIKLPHEQVPSPYTTDEMTFRYFFTRKVALSFYSQAYVYFQGGLGTLDELFEIITLIQTKKVPKLPVILVGHQHWDDLDAYIKNHLLKNRTISPGDEQIYTIVDSVDEAVQIIVDEYNKN